MVRSRRIDAPPSVVYDWHERPGALERLAPPWERTTVESRTDGIQPGSRVTLRTRVMPGLRVRMVAEHRSIDPPRSFTDAQVQGPFAAWHHVHRMEPTDDDTTRLVDDVSYRLPLGRLGRTVAGPIVRRRLHRMFAYRQSVTAGDIAAHRATKGAAPMRIAITGASGLIGSALTSFLTTGGHEVVPLVRTGPAEGAIAWDPAAGTIDAESLRGIDAVVHLAGEGIASGRWTDERKERIRSSRVTGTGLIARTLAEMDDGPRILVSASAIGFYGDRGDEELDESSEPGTGFLPEVVRAWEDVTEPARAAGLRVANVRIGIVQSAAGGALGTQLPIFKLGLGAPMGSGRQWVSWITIDDLLGIVLHCLTDDEVSGPVNATAPNPVTNREYTQVLAKVLGRWSLPIGVPRFAPGLVLGGELAEDLLFSSAKVLPRVARESGYTFRHTDLEPGLRAILGR